MGGSSRVFNETALKDASSWLSRCVGSSGVKLASVTERMEQSLWKEKGSWGESE